jgi:hypothetical protein
MRKLMMLSLLVLGAAVAGLFSPRPAAASGSGGTCVTYCSVPNACGYVCCFQTCCGNRCVDLDCAPPPPCGGDN